MDKGVLVYITRDGDRWDTVAHKHYGDALMIGGLIAANPHLPITEAFGSGQTVFVPVLARDKVALQEQLPPWFK